MIDFLGQHWFHLFAVLGAFLAVAHHRAKTQSKRAVEAARRRSETRDALAACKDAEAESAKMRAADRADIAAIYALRNARLLSAAACRKAA